MPGTQKKKLPQAAYPVPPRIVGVDWLELPVSKPARSAEIYSAIGLLPRSTVGRAPRLAVGGVELLLRQRRPKAPGNGASPPRQGVRIQLAVDDVDAKRQQLIDLGLKPKPLRRGSRGDRCFEWHDPDGHVFCFVGPARRPEDRNLE